MIRILVPFFKTRYSLAGQFEPFVWGAPPKWTLYSLSSQTHFNVSPFSKVMGVLQSLFGQSKSNATKELLLMLKSKMPLLPPFNIVKPPGVCALILTGLFKSVDTSMLIFGKQLPTWVLSAQAKNNKVANKKKLFLIKLKLGFEWKRLQSTNILYICIPISLLFSVMGFFKFKSLLFIAKEIQECFFK